MVTGIGTVSAAAMDAPGFVETLKKGKTCISRLDDPRLAGLTATHAGQISAPLTDPADPYEVKILDRNVHLALLALREALQRAGFKGDIHLGPRAGVVMGTCSGGMLSIEDHYAHLVQGKDPIDDARFFSKRYHTTAKVLAWAAGAEGPALTVVTACAAGSGALAQGADLIRAGLADLVVAGGSDTLARSTLVGFDALKVTCQGTCTPFSQNIGLNLGEGAAFLVLEALEYARERNAPIVAELLGAGLSNDAYHPTAPDPSARGQVAAMARALRDAGLPPESIDYINAHGTGTRANDSAESRAISNLLASRANGVPTSATKSMIGHCLGAAGALEAAATILCAQAGFVPSTAGFTTARDGCHLGDYVPDPGRPWQGCIALSNSFGFGGNNASILFDVAPDPEHARSALPGPEDADIAITGMGIVSPLGIGREWLLANAETGISDIERFEAPVQPFPAGCVPPIDSRAVDRRLDLKGMDLCSVFATLATREALVHAGFKPRPKELAQVGMVIGLATGPSQGEMAHLTEVFQNNFALDRLGAFPYVVPNEVAGHVARALLLKGHNTALAAGLGAGLSATICAAVAVALGHADTVLAGAADELSQRTVADGYAVGQWGPGTPIVPGEGAAVLMIETSTSAAKRGVTPLARIMGFGLATAAAHPHRGSTVALESAIDTALGRAGMSPTDIQSICHCSMDKEDSQRAIKGMFRATPAYFSLVDRIGLAEATLPLVNLSYLITKGAPGAPIMATALSPEGLASALVVKVSNNAN